MEIGLPACTSLSATKFSDVTTSSLGSGLKEHVTRRTLKDNNGLLHHQVNFPTTVGKKHLNTSLQTMQGKTRKKHLVGYYCLTVVKQISFAVPISVILSKIASKSILKTQSNPVSLCKGDFGFFLVVDISLVH